METRTRKMVVVASVVAFAVAGCAQLPTSGAPREFKMVVPDSEPLNQIGASPQDGSTPSQLVTDFMRASAAGAFDDYMAAREYLMPTAALTWQPTSQVTVFPTDHMPSTAEVEGGSATAVDVEVDVPTTATLDDAGFLHQIPNEISSTLKFKLAKNDKGEWRIAALDDGIIISQSSFQAGFNQYNVYFASTDGRALIPDPRWVPRTRKNGAAHLAQAILNGPPEILAGATKNNLAEGLDLTGVSVDVTDDQVAQVNLHGEGPVSAESKRLLQWQFEQTLTQYSTVQKVEVIVNKAPLSPEVSPTPPRYDLDRSIWVQDGAIREGVENDSRVVVTPEVAGTEPKFPAVGPLIDSPVAWVTGENAVMIQPLGATSPMNISIADPSRPSIDRWGNTWISAKGNRGAVTVIKPDGGTMNVDTGLNERQVEALSVSSDGARIALITKAADGATVWIGTVAWHDDGTISVSKLSADNRIGNPALDIAWANPTTLLVLTGTKDRSIESVPIGGFATKYPAPADAVWVSSGSGSGGWTTQRADQEEFQRVGATWRPMGAGRAYIGDPG